MNRELRISIYSHDDDFIDLLYTSDREFDGQCFNPILTVNANGAKTLALSLPIKILNKEKNEYEDNIRWQYIVNQYKIRVEREGEQIEEFVLKDYVESHSDGDQLTVDISCMSLAEFELGQTGYNLTFSEETLYIYPENVDPNDPDNEPMGVAESDIHFWAQKIVENTDWDYRVESYYEIDTDMTEDNRQTIPVGDEHVGKNQFYENDRIVDYTDDNQPIKQELYDVKERIIKTEKSNRWNISQDLCESFEVWADYEIIYENGAVASKTIVFKNDVPEDSLFSVKYSKNLKNISRQVDDSQIVTKMYVPPLENPNVDDGMVSIANNDKNYAKENYLLDFSWYLGEERKDTELKNKQLLPDDLSYNFARTLYAIPVFEAEEVTDTKTLIETYQRNLRFRNKFIEQATQNLSKAKEELSELKAQYEFYLAQKSAALEQVNTITDEIALIPKGAQWKEDKTVYIYQEAGYWIIRFSEVGIKTLPNPELFTRPNNLVDLNGTAYTAETINQLELAVHKREPITQTITEARLVNAKMGDTQDYAAFNMDLEYYPLDFQNKMKQYWLTKVNEAVAQLLILGRGKEQGDTTGLIYDKEQEVDSLKLSLLYSQQEKTQMVNEIELLLAPFVREGYWEDTSYTTYMNQGETLTKQIPEENAIETLVVDQQWTQDYWCYKIPNTQIANVQDEDGISHPVFLYDIIDIDSIEVMNKSIVTSEYDENFKMYVKGVTDASQGVDYTVEYGYTNTDKVSLTNRGIYINFYEPDDGTIFTQTADTQMYVRAKARGTDAYVYEGYIRNQTYNLNGARARMWYAPLEQILTIDHENTILSSIEVVANSARAQYIDENTLQLVYNNYDLTYGTDYYTFKETIDGKTYTRIRLNYTANVPLMTFDDNSYANYDIRFNYDVTSKYYYNDALDVMKESSVPQVTYNVSIANLAEISHPGLDYTNFKPRAGTRIPIYDEELNFNGLLGFINTISFNLLEPQNTEITISNFKDKFEDLFQKITAATIQLQNKGDYYDYATTITDSTGVINKDLLADTLMQNNIELSLNKNNDVVWSEQGIEVTSKILNSNGVYGKMKITSNGIFIADSYDEYGNYKWETAITPSYINASKMVVGKLDTRQIQIWNSSQPRFLWNENGIYAYGQDSNNNTDYNTYVLYNQDGLQFRQLVERTNGTQFTNLLQKPDFSAGYENFWSTDQNATLDIEASSGYNVLVSTPSVDTEVVNIYHASLSLNKKHKYYFRATVGLSDLDETKEYILLAGLQNFTKAINYFVSDGFITISGIVTGATMSNLYYAGASIGAVIKDWSFKLTQPMLLDLTDTFGENITITNDELDKLPFFAGTHVVTEKVNLYKDAVSLNWKGLALSTQEGALQLTSENGLEVLQPIENSVNQKDTQTRVQVGKWEEIADGKTIIKYGIRGLDENGHTFFEVSQEGFKISYGDSNDTFENVIDNSTTYSVYINSSNGLYFTDKDIETTITATVMKGQKDVTDQLKPENFIWTRISSNTRADEQWNAKHKGVGRQITIDDEDVNVQTTFRCTIEI